MLSSNYLSPRENIIVVLSSVNVFLILLPICDSLSLVDPIQQVPSQQLTQHVHKRQGFEDYRVCASNFEIHQDKIIRTEESKRLGAKYLNGKDVVSKDECVKFCCDTTNCNVFVLEEKVFNQQMGTCYLFECGTPENFKCKFTRHLNYSSAVLIINRPQLQLEDEIQYSQHERELTSLRKNGRMNTAPDDVIPVMRDTKDSIKISDDGNVDDPTFKKSGKCSRYQFECRTSGECIAIYNACDGIPQCADKSDEDVELGCPTTPPIIPKRMEPIRPNRVILGGNDPNVDTAFKQTAAGSAPIANAMDQNFLLQQQQRQQQQFMAQQQQQQQQQQFSPEQSAYNRQTKYVGWPSRLKQQPHYEGSPIRNDLPPMNEIYSNAPNANVNSKTQLSQQGAMAPAPNYASGREGEMPGNVPAFVNSYSWTNKNEEDQISKQNYGPLQNFNHKPKDTINSNPFNEGVEYSNTPANNAPYDIYSNGYAGNNAYPSNANVWHRKYDNVLSNSNLKNANLPANIATPEYAYEILNATMAKNGDLVRIGNFTGAIREIGKIETDKKLLNTSTSNEKSGRSSINRTTPTAPNKLQSISFDSTPRTTIEMTIARKQEASTRDNSVGVTQDDVQNSHRKLENHQINSAQAFLLDDVQIHDGLTEQPSGAFVSLTIGICVTAMMVLVVGCRMKVVRKRLIRRGGKLPYAHDADFLVNGMYL